MKVVPTPIQIRFSDVDMAGHVHHAVYLQWFELGRMALLGTFIPKDHDWKVNGLILARNEIDHRMPVRLGDELVVEAWCSKVGQKSFDLRYAIMRNGGARPGLCSEGRSVMVCFDYMRERTVELPHPWRIALEGN